MNERGFPAFLLVRGDFTHYELNALPCFFGSALIDAYQSEKQIDAIGLFMQGSIVSDSDIFDTVKFKTNYDFVFITQNLKRVEDMGRFPLDRFVIEETELNLSLGARGFIPKAA